MHVRVKKAVRLPTSDVEWDRKSEDEEESSLEM